LNRSTNKRYEVSSLLVLGSFLVLAAIVSPRLNHDNDSAAVKDDISAFFVVMNSHVSASFNQFMIVLTEYGREVAWIVAGIVLFVFCG
jgi:hypothetical protein